MALLAAASGCSPRAARTSAAELVIVNAHIYTLAWAEPSREGVPASDAPFDGVHGWHHDATALAISDGRILYVGSDSAALTFRAANTRVIDLHGQVLLPGLVDAHTHVAELGQSLERDRKSVV